MESRLLSEDTILIGPIAPSRGTRLYQHIREFLGDATLLLLRVVSSEVPGVMVPGNALSALQGANR